MSTEFVSNFKQVQKNLESFTFRLGIFPENDARREVNHQPNKLVRVRNVGYKNRKTRRASEVKNSDILRQEYNAGRNWLLDSVDKRKNPDARIIMNLLQSFLVVEKQNFDFWVKNRRRCNGFIAIFRRFVDSNPYQLHNREKTVKIKGFDAYLRDSRQLQNSITCKLLYNDIKISEGSNAGRKT